MQPDENPAIARVATGMRLIKLALIPILGLAAGILIGGEAGKIVATAAGVGALLMFSVGAVFIIFAGPGALQDDEDGEEELPMLSPAPARGALDDLRKEQ